MNPISILFFDLNDEDCESLLKEVKQNFKDVLCIGIGREQTAPQQSQLFALGMDDYITTPISPELLDIRMKRVLDLIEVRPDVTPEEDPIEEAEDIPFEQEELDEIEDTLKDLQLQILLMGKTDLTSDDVYNITRLLGKVQSIFMYMVSTFPLATSLHELCEEIEANVEGFISHSQELNIIALSFVNDLVQWKNAIFYDRSQKADFLNDSIMANVKTFISFLETPNEVEEDELDTIFNF
jgi:CheY-like chemotaxis protein